MKNELIQLAKEKGFIPENLTIGWKEDYYLWLCSLQKWLREVHNIDVFILKNNFNSTYFCRTYSINEEGSWKEGTYGEALERGLQQGLNLIR